MDGGAAHRLPTGLPTGFPPFAHIPTRPTTTKTFSFPYSQSRRGRTVEPGQGSRSDRRRRLGLDAVEPSPSLGMGGRGGFPPLHPCHVANVGARGQRPRIKHGGA